MVRKKQERILAILFGMFLGILTGQVQADPSEMKVLKTIYLENNQFVAGKDDAVYDIATGPDGHIYVAQFRRNKITVFDSELQMKKTIPDVPSPHGIAVDSEGNVYAATFRNGRVMKFDSEGKAIADWDKDLVAQTKIQQPVALGVDKDNNIYIADYALHTIIKTNSQGQWLKTFPGKFLPHGIVVDDQNVYVADRDARAVQIYSLDGVNTATWTGAVNFDPLSVCLVDGWYILVPNYGNGLLTIFDPNGHILGQDGKAGSLPGEFQAVTDCAYLAGNLFVSEQDGNRIQKFEMPEIITRQERRNEFLRGVEDVMPPDQL